MIDFEVGDLTLWVSIDSAQPFPINIFSKSGEWKYTSFEKELSDTERITLEGFVKDTMGAMNEMWRSNMKRRLLWDKKQLRKKK